MNRVSVNSNEKGNPRVAAKQRTVRCFCCRNVGHKAIDKVCPARGKLCRKCNNPEKEHDQRFENVVRVLSSKGLTLNPSECQFKMSHLEFLGHVSSASRIGPADVKVKAVVKAREPKNAAEERSILGLVDFTVRFMPDPSTVSAPLRQLTKNGEPFVRDQERQQSFDELKK